MTVVVLNEHNARVEPGDEVIFGCLGAVERAFVASLMELGETIREIQALGRLGGNRIWAQKSSD